MKTIAGLVLIVLGALAMFVATAVAETPYEVWVSISRILQEDLWWDGVHL